MTADTVAMDVNSTAKLVRKIKFDAAFLLAPAVIFYCVIYVWPLLNTFHTSINTIDGLSIKEYLRFFDSNFYLSVLIRTVRISILVTILTAIVGYPLAVYLSQRSRKGRAIVTMIVLAPMMVSAVVRSYGWIMILGPNGVLVNLLAALGLSGISPLLYTEAGIVIALTHVFLPFMVLAITGSLQQINMSLPLAANNLGAGWIRTFWKITLPLSMPGVTAGSVIVFCLAASGFVTPALVGGSSVPVMSYLVYQEGLLTLNWPFASAVAIILLLTTAVVTAVYSVWANNSRYISGGG